MAQTGSVCIKERDIYYIVSADVEKNSSIYIHILYNGNGMCSFFFISNLGYLFHQNMIFSLLGFAKVLD